MAFGRGRFTAAAAVAQSERRFTVGDYFWQKKPWQAFKNFAIIFSFIVNFVLLLVLLLAAPLIIPVVDSVARPLVGGLSDSFVQMGDASIERTIAIDDTVPVSFTLPLSTTTDVVLDRDVPLEAPATFIFPGGGGTINGTVRLQLPEGLILPIRLDFGVPVSNTIPVQLDVGVDIPLEETELGEPFHTLQTLFVPLDRLLQGLPASNQELFDRITGPGPDAGEATDQTTVAPE